MGKGDRLGKNQAMGPLCVVPLLGVCVVTSGGDKAAYGDGALQLGRSSKVDGANRVWLVVRAWPCDWAWLAGVANMLEQCVGDMAPRKQPVYWSIVE